MEQKKYTTKQASVAMGVCVQRITAKIKNGHFPNTKRCECGHTYMITEHDLVKEIDRKIKREHK